MEIDADESDCDGADRVDAASERAVGTGRIERLEGIWVDEWCRSSVKGYFAVGRYRPAVGSSCAEHPLLGVDLDSSTRDRLSILYHLHPLTVFRGGHPAFY